MKEMVYGKSKFEVLHEGIYKDYKFFIISYGSHPCAYVENKKNYKDFDCDELINIDVHGGFTFCGEKCGVNCIGWDYNHLGDFSSYISVVCGFDDKKWSTQEIYEEVKSVIDQLESMEE